MTQLLSEVLDLSSAQDLLNDIGRFAARLPGFRPRAAQIDMANAVEAAITDAETLVVEAETGTGKTLAYLIPALLADGPVLISTGTKSLQDQLFLKDLPLVMESLGLHRRVALLKGRANYLCPYHLEVNRTELPAHAGIEVRHQLNIVERWSKRTLTGDLAELKELPEDAPIWPYVTSTRDNCLGQDCPLYNECPLMQARKQALEADLVVINHHLFFADAALKEEGVSSFLPNVKTVIFDEAHQLPDIAAEFFGRHLSARQVRELIRDVLAQLGVLPLEAKSITDRLKKATDDLQLALGAEGTREPWQKLAQQTAVQQALAAMQEAQADLTALLEADAKANRDVESCHERSRQQQDFLGWFVKMEDVEQVYWFEVFARSFMLHATPLSVARSFGAHRAQYPCAWIFTSATLSVAGDFHHFLTRMGLGEALTLALASPFDFRHQTLLYVPDGLPDPNDPAYTDQLVEAMLPVIKAAGGRTFFLFTSHRALKRAARLLEGKLPFPLLVQNSVGRRQLLEDFRQLGNAVLLGAASFWEGIDVRGEALSCVIIDKLPFASPGDPVTAARSDRLKAEGGSPFFELSLPEAIIALRQGVGRLIRDVDDTGLLVLADPRVVTKNYGKRVLDSLPPMPRTRRLDVVQRFFEKLGKR